jgi:hypothetical protein
MPTIVELSEYDRHLETMKARNAVIERLKNRDATHVTNRPVWHGYDRPAGTSLVIAPELIWILDKGRAEIRDAHGCVAHWFVESDGNICNLWECEYDDAPYCCGDDATLPDGITISRGSAIASCGFCGYRCAYWECACELVHECNGGDE